MIDDDYDEDEMDDIPESEKDYHAGCGFMTAIVLIVVTLVIVMLFSVLG